MQQIKILTLLIMVMMLSNCGKNKVELYKDNNPKLDIKEFFTGDIKAWGIVQDRKGRVIRKFDIVMQGSWPTETQGILNEKFHYYDGENQKRIWKITKIADDKYEGRADDILNVAKGDQAGDAVRWHYMMDLPVGDTTYRIKFDDWMWLMNDDVLINRSYMKKFGFTVAELTIFMQKQK